MKRITKLSCLLLAIALLCSLCGCTAMETVNSQVESVLTDITSTTHSTEESTTTTTTTTTTTAKPTTTTAKPTTTTIKPTTTTAKPTTTTMAPPEESVSETVYITRTGKRWHRSSSCNGGTYYASTLAQAEARGLTPCKKCAGG